MGAPLSVVVRRRSGDDIATRVQARCGADRHRIGPVRSLAFGTT
ncbi:hypothetical protein C7S14_0429 [Burkholderia cepacia]|nr:hypothetical protein C7S14_0429 [Burkholderia cepacia]